MRALRFLVLLLVLVVAFIATPTVELRPFASLLPADWMADSVLLAKFRQWVMDDLARTSLILTTWAALTFGLLAVPWPYSRVPFYPSQAQRTAISKVRGWRAQLRWWSGLIFVILALCSSVGMLLLLQQKGEDLLVHLLWVGSILFLLFGSLLLTLPYRLLVSPESIDGAETQQESMIRTIDARRPTNSWPMLAFILLLGLLLYGWSLPTIPPHVDTATAQLGLQAMTMSSGVVSTGVASTNEASSLESDDTLFATIAMISRPEERFFGVALASTALLNWWLGDLLLSTRIIGVLAALGCAVATWLVGVELFARRVYITEQEIPIEDHGQLPTLMATWLVLFNMATLYFSRQPILLEATAWGLLGCWALLRSFRKRDRLALCLSGLLLGFGYIHHGNGLIFVVTALFWWVGLIGVQSGLLPHLMPTKRSYRFHVGDFLLWILGIGIVLAPVATARFEELSLWLSQLPTSMESALTVLLANFAPPLAAYPAALFHYVLLPFFPLAIGVLLFNLDRRQGWMITTMLLSALTIATLIQPQDLRWELLTPLVPAIAFALAFTLDRLRISFVQIGGRWIQQFVGFGLLGILLWVASATVITYASFALLQSDSKQAIGYSLRALPDEQSALVYLPNNIDETIGLNAERATADATLRFLTTDRINQAGGNIAFVDALPATVSPGTLILLPAAEMEILATVQERYPTGTIQIKRDVRSNPLLILFEVPQE